MADLKAVAADCKTALVNAAKVIRGLKVERDNALAAAHPEDVVAAEEKARQNAEEAEIQASLSASLADLGAAISEAQAAPVVTPKKKTEAPKT